MYILYFSEFDECANPNVSRCNQTCINSFGSFSCECNQGYILQEEGRICEGIIYFLKIDFVASLGRNQTKVLVSEESVGKWNFQARSHYAKEISKSNS